MWSAMIVASISKKWARVRVVFNLGEVQRHDPVVFVVDDSISEHGAIEARAVHLPLHLHQPVVPCGADVEPFSVFTSSTPSRSSGVACAMWARNPSTVAPGTSRSSCADTTSLGRRRRARSGVHGVCDRLLPAVAAQHHIVDGWLLDRPQLSATTA